jgi:hypothetical protein
MRENTQISNKIFFMAFVSRMQVPKNAIFMYVPLYKFNGKEYVTEISVMKLSQ